MITMMVLLCYVNLSGMSLEYIVIVLMNISLLGGQECTDSVNVWQYGNFITGSSKLAIIPRLNFTCSGRITSIRARLSYDTVRNDYPLFQVWRLTSVGSTIYNKIGEVQLQSDDQLSVVNDNVQIASIILTGNNTIEVQSGDVVGYYHPPDPRYLVITTQADGYRLYHFSGSHDPIDLYNNVGNKDGQQPLIQFTIGKCAFIQAVLSYNTLY